MTELYKSSHNSVSTFERGPSSYLLRQSLDVPWRPSAYYRSAQLNPLIPLSKTLPDPTSTTAKMTQLDSIKLPTIFSAARNALYNRYSAKEWQRAMQTNYLASDTARNSSQKLRSDTIRICRETDDRLRNAQRESGRKLGERVNDVTFWRNEINNELDRMIIENASLTDTRCQLEKAILDSEIPLKTAQECLYHREKRQGIDLVHDAVERDLIKEVDNIRDCQNRLRKARNRIEAQISLNRAAQHELEKDQGDKFVTLKLDNHAHQLTTTSQGLGFYDGVETLDNTITVPETWAKFTNDNILRSQTERIATIKMKNEIDSVLNSTLNDMWSQWNKTNTSFAKRIEEIGDAKNKISDHLSKVLQEIFDMEKNIELLKKGLQDKNVALQLAQTRLETRGHRMNMELCRDFAQNMLVQEVFIIKNSVDQMYKTLEDAESTLQKLRKNKCNLEHDLAVKANSLFIDKEKCMGLRKTFPLVPRITKC